MLGFPRVLSYRSGVTDTPENLAKALEAMTHLQTTKQYPDMNALMAIQPFALLNQITLSSDLVGGTPYTGQNFPINASYAAGAVPAGAAVPAARGVRLQS